MPTPMSLFTSDREPRLWLWTLAAIVAIYSTLGPAGALVGALRERSLLRRKPGTADPTHSALSASTG